MRIKPHLASREEIFEAIDLNYKAYDEIEKKVSSISLPDDATAGFVADSSLRSELRLLAMTFTGTTWVT